MADVIHRAPDAVVSAVLRLGASAVLLGGALLLAGCGEAPEAKAPEPRPVRTVLATSRAASDAVTLTGQVEAQNEAMLRVCVVTVTPDQPEYLGTPETYKMEDMTSENFKKVLSRHLAFIVRSATPK